jgi:hypothetical protein
MIKLKNILSEGLAWERKEGKGLPTLAEVQAEYERKMADSEENDDVYLAANESRDENRSSNESGLMVIGRTQLDNNKIGDIIDGLGLHAEWDARHGHWLFPEDEQSYDELEELLNNEFGQHGIDARFEGIFNEAIDEVSSRTHVVYSCNVELADGTIKPGVRISVPKGDNAEQQVRDKIQDRFGKDSKIRAIAKAQNPHINDNDKDDEPRWQDNDGDGKWYEKGDDVKENVNESFVGRLKKNFIGGATRK